MGNLTLKSHGFRALTSLLVTYAYTLCSRCEPNGRPDRRDPLWAYGFLPLQPNPAWFPSILASTRQKFVIVHQLISAISPLIPDGSLPEDTFSFFFTRARLNGSTEGVFVEEPGGELTLGGTNPQLYQGEIDYLPVQGITGFWMLSMDGELPFHFSFLDIVC